MSQEKGRESETRDESADPDGEALADGEKRILSEEEAEIAESDLADSEAATVLAASRNIERSRSWKSELFQLR